MRDLDDARARALERDREIDGALAVLRRGPTPDARSAGGPSSRSSRAVTVSSSHASPPAQPTSTRSGSGTCATAAPAALTRRMLASAGTSRVVAMAWMGTAQRVAERAQASPPTRPPADRRAGRRTRRRSPPGAPRARRRARAAPRRDRCAARAPTRRPPSKRPAAARAARRRSRGRRGARSVALFCERGDGLVARRAPRPPVVAGERHRSRRVGEDDDARADDALARRHPHRPQHRAEQRRHGEETASPRWRRRRARAAGARRAAATKLAAASTHAASHRPRGQVRAGAEVRREHRASGRMGSQGAPAHEEGRVDLVVLVVRAEHVHRDVHGEADGALALRRRRPGTTGCSHMPVAPRASAPPRSCSLKITCACPPRTIASSVAGPSTRPSARRRR